MKNYQKTIDINGVVVNKLENGLVVSEFKPVVLNIDDAKEILDTIFKINDGKKAWVIVNTGLVKGTTRESNLFMKNNSAKFINAVAIIINSLVARMAASFFMKLAHPGYPIKTFQNFAEAENWIIELRNNGK